jgi:OOP family OmpA-OmpF porin
VLISIKRENALGAILLPVIEQAIFTSVQNNPKVLADALFPVMGAAIRKSISDTFREMIQSLNQTLENQFSVERIKWRLEAIFSSKSFAEIVLLKGVKYHVKSVFLIHKETGLLIQDAYPDHLHLDDADMVSSMLTAVQDFVKDSFGNQLNSTDTLDTIKLNDFNVWIENGPLAYLAVVIEGSPPETTRQIFKSNLEEIHGKYSPVLSGFEGDSDDGTPLIPFLKNCVIRQEFEDEKKNHTKTYVILSVITLALGYWVFVSLLENYRWNNFVNELKTEKSVLIIEDGFESGTPFIIGMKDGLKSNFGQIAQANSIDSTSINYHWTNYLSLEPEFVYQRMIRQLKPSLHVKTRLQNDTIIISGKASQNWINSAQNYLSNQSDFIKYDIHFLNPTELDSVAIIGQQFKKYQLRFTYGVSRLNQTDKVMLNELITMFNQYQRFEPKSKLKIVVTPDNIGSVKENLKFALKRYKSVQNHLVTEGVNMEFIELEIDSNLTDMKPRNMEFIPHKIE